MDCDAALLARFVVTMSNGIAVQAAGGVSRGELMRLAVGALRNWPPVWVGDVQLAGRIDFQREFEPRINAAAHPCAHVT
ncbi:MAG: hypothetical protein WBB07_22990 [Mycobacterium sp.]